jgi:hypothetical protein
MNIQEAIVFSGWILSFAVFLYLIKNRGASLLFLCLFIVTWLYEFVKIMFFDK